MVFPIFGMRMSSPRRTGTYGGCSLPRGSCKLGPEGEGHIPLWGADSSPHSRCSPEDSKAQDQELALLLQWVVGSERRTTGHQALELGRKKEQKDVGAIKTKRRASHTPISL